MDVTPSKYRPFRSCSKVPLSLAGARPISNFSEAKAKLEALITGEREAALTARAVHALCRSLATHELVGRVHLDADGGRELVAMRWGLIPVWWKKAAKDVPVTFNARVETVAAKPMFRSAFEHRRCIVPASGFLEWTGGKGEKVPHLFSSADGSHVMGFAGLWEHWRDPEGEEVLSCTIVVSGASDWMTAYHDRMPVLLGADQFDAWLGGTAGPDVLQPAAEGALREWVVDARVNRTGVGDDDPATVARAEAAA